jgi:hypothetical protein
VVSAKPQITRPEADRWLMYLGGVLLLVPGSMLVSWMVLLIVEVILVGVLVTEVCGWVVEQCGVSLSG